MIILTERQRSHGQMKG